MPGRPGALQRSMHPMVWALYADLDALWRRLGPFEDPRVRLIESLARYVRLTGPGQVPKGPWWEGVLRMLLSMWSVLEVLPHSVDEARYARWLHAAKALD